VPLDQGRGIDKPDHFIPDNLFNTRDVYGVQSDMLSLYVLGIPLGATTICLP